MNHSTESSVLFSLQELQTLEERRIEAEREAERRLAGLAADQATAAERQRHAEEEARRLAEEAQARVEAARAREEAAHLAAIRDAALCKATREADGKLRLEEQRLRLEHESAMEVLRLGVRHRRFVALLGAVGVTGIVAGALVLRSWSTEVAAAQQKRAEAVHAQTLSLQRQAEAIEAERRELARLAQAAREAAQAAPSPAPELPANGSVAPPPGHPPNSLPKPKKPDPRPAHTTCANQWDPLCASLP